MTYPPPGYPTPGYPQPGPAGPPAHLRGRRPIQIGVILAVIGIVAMVVGIVILATKSLGKVDDFQRVTVAQGTGTVHFDKAGGYVAYYESSTVHSGTTTIPKVGVSLTGPSGTAMTLDTPYGGRSDNKIKSLKYNYHGHSGAALYQFHIDTPGTYQVALIPNSLDAPDATMAFGKSIAGGTAAGGALTVIGVLLLIIGVVLLIIGLIKRGRHKRRLAAGGGFYPPAPAWPAQPGGWPPQPGQQQPGLQQPGPQAWAEQPAPQAWPQPGAQPQHPGPQAWPAQPQPEWQQPAQQQPPAWPEQQPQVWPEQPPAQQPPSWPEQPPDPNRPA